MIELHFWPTGNGQKIAIFLEEAGLDYETHPVRIHAGEQFKPEFLKISPNNRIPAIVDRDPEGGGAPISVFESGAILIYLAEKTGKFLPKDIRGRTAALEWLFWQVGGLGPMAGQKNHFKNKAPEKLTYAIDRYVNETNRLYGVLNKQLQGRDYIIGDYSIADMACYPWCLSGIKNYNDDMSDFPNLVAWFERVKARDAVKRAYQKSEVIKAQQPSEEEARKWMYGQTAESVAAMTEAAKPAS